ncbi:hypothetical protein LZP85_01640 [Priestia flexa]|jgi:hypothetical protein|uniref:Uncharacterized protein n=2 Tax=Priestia TaxID=2800373 RepID=A0A0V8JPG1_9BACI|nr:MULTISPECIES: hypothetical protein [Bacillaceae]AQX55975.1 hypothetical protein BC359_17790 [Priestia flexa]KSU88749.1 hypothetical protein AS180_06305 [Priestia veravalensis]KZB92099.1 hypothetical protein A2U94_07340 [Bacillus sp. VT 712]MBN8253531.1 hypothetical protein [Priestia flexa]MBN8435586.1 hypothetical protein [Priestia flexa]
MRKREVWKYILLIVTIAGQVISFIFLMVNSIAALLFYGFYILTFAILLSSFLWEEHREKEKELEDY